MHRKLNPANCCCRQKTVDVKTRCSCEVNPRQIGGPSRGVWCVHELASIRSMVGSRNTSEAAACSPASCQVHIRLAEARSLAMQHCEAP